MNVDTLTLKKGNNLTTNACFEKKMQRRVNDQDSTRALNERAQPFIGVCNVTWKRHAAPIMDWFVIGFVFQQYQ